MREIYTRKHTHTQLQQQQQQKTTQNSERLREKVITIKTVTNLILNTRVINNVIFLRFLILKHSLCEDKRN